MRRADNILEAMKATDIPAGESGLWSIGKTTTPEPIISVRHNTMVELPAGTYTFLRRLTTATMHLEPPGEVVMEDTPFELRTHLEFALRARGRVLVTGLGLGCVVRGLLANPDVDQVVCIENSKNVLQLVGPYMPTDRLTIIQAEALEWTAKNTEHFDSAWHDLWTNREAGEPHLDVWHMRLINNCRRTITRQGAWAFSRPFRRLLKDRGLQWVG